MTSTADQRRGGDRFPGVQVILRAIGQDMDLDIQQTDRLALAHLGHRRMAQAGRVHQRDGAVAHHLEDVARIDEGGRVLVQSDAHREGIVGQRGEQPAQAVALAEVLVLGGHSKPATRGRLKTGHQS